MQNHSKRLSRKSAEILTSKFGLTNSGFFHYKDTLYLVFCYIDTATNTIVISGIFKRLRKIYKKKIVVPGDCDKDIIHDYISATMPHIKAQRKQKAVKKTKDLLQYKYPNQNITLKVAEDILKYAAKKKNVD